MKKGIWVLFTSILGLMNACKPEQEMRMPAYPSLHLTAGKTRYRPAPEASADQLAQQLAQVLSLSSKQALQIRQLTLAQTGEEQRMWHHLADTAYQQLHSIAHKYDEHVQGVLTARQYQQFTKLREARSKRRRARVAAIRASMVGQP